MELNRQRFEISYLRRNSVTTLGNGANRRSRRRVIIVPSIKCAAREVNVTAEDKGKDMDDTGYLVSLTHINASFL